MTNELHFKQKALQWANSLSVCCYLDSNHYPDPHGRYDWVVAAGAAHELLLSSAAGAFNQLKDFHETHKAHLFGFLSYDLKNDTEKLSSTNEDHLGFPQLYFFVPQYLIAGKGNHTEVLIGGEDIINQINELVLPATAEEKPLTIQPRLDKSIYLDRVEKLREHIHRGDIYEINFCQEFFAENAKIDPLAVFTRLNSISPTPFAGYFKVREHYILSATPERFLAKIGSKLLSQPIKGTAKRGRTAEEDEEIKNRLRNDPKEQAENVMIVDLVRHDLTKSALKGTVITEELFGVYTFPTVHQLISTISCQVDPGIHFADVIKNCFPMGSMTGAPKVRAMELIEQYELTMRGAYSGTFGWISPDGDFDFNVVIRSILYNANTQYLSYHVGGAITYASDPEKEYEECLLKATAMRLSIA